MHNPLLFNENIQQKTYKPLKTRNVKIKPCTRFLFVRERSQFYFVEELCCENWSSCPSVLNTTAQ